MKVIPWHELIPGLPFVVDCLPHGALPQQQTRSPQREKGAKHRLTAGIEVLASVRRQVSDPGALLKIAPSEYGHRPLLSVRFSTYTAVSTRRCSAPCGAKLSSTTPTLMRSFRPSAPRMRET